MAAVISGQYAPCCCCGKRVYDSIRCLACQATCTGSRCELALSDLAQDIVEALNFGPDADAEVDVVMDVLRNYPLEELGGSR